MIMTIKLNLQTLSLPAELTSFCLDHMVFCFKKFELTFKKSKDFTIKFCWTNMKSGNIGLTLFHGSKKKKTKKKVHCGWSLEMGDVLWFTTGHTNP